MDKEMRQKFWDTLCSFEEKEPASDMKKLSETIKYPKFLYRYRAVSNNTIVALQENKVYFSSADSYDDPFDTYLRIDWNKIKSMIGKSFASSLRSPAVLSLKLAFSKAGDFEKLLITLSRFLSSSSLRV